MTSLPWVSGRSEPPTLLYWLPVQISVHYTIAVTLSWKRPEKSPFWQVRNWGLGERSSLPKATLTQRQNWIPNPVSLIYINLIHFQQILFVQMLCARHCANCCGYIILQKHREAYCGCKNMTTYPHVALWVSRTWNWFPGKFKSAFKQADFGEQGWGEMG